MSFVATFIVLALAGAIDAGYLAYKHGVKKRKPLICPLNHDCSKVTESKWASVLGVRNEILGLIFYVAVFAGILASLYFPVYALYVYFWLTLFSGGAFLFSLFLVFIQISEIKDYCFYCVISAFINLMIFMNALALAIP